MISLRNVRVVFAAGSARARVAIDGLSLDIAAGEFVTVIGSNGAGKSTLLGLLAGEVTPSAGRVVIGGRDLTHAPPHVRARYVARVFQDPNLGSCAELSIRDNFLLAAARGQRRYLLPATRGRRVDRVREAVAALGVGLEDRLEMPMGQLSGGMRQAACLAMAGLTASDVLLLDEHTAALDPQMAAAVLAMTDALVARSGRTTLMITHDMATALAHGTRTLRLEGGRIAQDLHGAARASAVANDLFTSSHANRGACHVGSYL